ncbi:MAG: nucleotide exchange factor GrpE [Deltaproteobacteria bacterium]|nr:nucleotide exchange factor GrpE [Deltaproteobacteria bacterium]
MRAFLLRLLGAESAAPGTDSSSSSFEALSASLADVSTTLASTATSAEIATLTDVVQKMSRAQARISLKLDDVEGKLEAGFTDLRNGQAAGGDDLPRLDPVLDAVDLLEEAARSARLGGDPALAAGIASIGARLGTFLEDAGVARVGAVGAAPDPRLFRVVGTESSDEREAGVITRVVRAAVLSGDKLVREGEVLIAAKPLPARTGSET